MATIRILQSLATLDRGGAEAIIMNMYRNMDREKMQFDFVVNDQTEPYTFEEEVINLGGRIYKVPKFDGRNLLSYRRKFEELFRKHPEWKIIHIHNTSSAMIFMDLAKKYNLITIAHAHFSNHSYNLRSTIQYVLRLPLKKTADYLLACSKQAGADVFRLDKEEVRVFPNAIETQDFIFNEQIRKKKRRELGFENEMVLGHVGRMDEHKNQQYVLDVFHEYHKMNPYSALLLIGQGETKEELVQQAEAYQISDKVKFLGVRSDVNELLQAMDIFVFPSISEGLPVTLVEAQAAGLPILASDTISDEVAITDLVTFKSIDIEPVRWAKEIDNQYLIIRNDTSKEIMSAGYDAKQGAVNLQNYYLSILGG